jgi:hypothetical protein
VEKCVFIALDSSKRDDKSAYGNGKRTSVQDTNGGENISTTIMHVFGMVEGISPNLNRVT